MCFLYQLLPKSAKQNDSNENGHIQEVMKVALGGVQGIKKSSYFLLYLPIYVIYEMVKPLLLMF